jgi:hypothetical protein
MGNVNTWQRSPRGTYRVLRGSLVDAGENREHVKYIAESSFHNEIENSIYPLTAAFRPNLATLRLAQNKVNYIWHNPTLSSFPHTNFFAMCSSRISCNASDEYRTIRRSLCPPASTDPPPAAPAHHEAVQFNTHAACSTVSRAVNKTTQLRHPLDGLQVSLHGVLQLRDGQLPLFLNNYGQILRFWYFTRIQNENGSRLSIANGE